EQRGHAFTLDRVEARTQLELALEDAEKVDGDAEVVAGLTREARLHVAFEQRGDGVEDLETIGAVGGHAINRGGGRGRARTRSRDGRWPRARWRGSPRGGA